MEDHLPESGNRIIWKDLESTIGLMGGSMKENIRMIRKTDMESMSGQIKENTWDTGTRESSTELENTLFQVKTRSSMDFGKMEGELNGLKLRKK